MPLSLPELNIQDTASWGVKAHGGELVIDPPYDVFPHIQVITLDVENNPDGTCAGIGLTSDGEVIHFFTASAVAKWSKDVFKDKQLVGHNIKYDVQMLRKWGFDVSPDQIIWDTQIAEYVKDSTKNRYGLKLLVKELFGSEYPDFKALTGTGKKAVTIGSLDRDIVANYNGLDVLFTHKLLNKQMSEMTDMHHQYMSVIELPTMRVLLEMEERGVQIDSNYIGDLDTRFNNELCSVINSIRDSYKTEINLNSHQQIKQLLLDKTGLRLDTTAAEELEKHQHIPLVKDILRYRGLAKLRNTYTKGMVERLDKDGRLHTRFNQTSTQTGRLSSSDPNLQNIPTRTDEGDLVRGGFVAMAGMTLIDIDYSQIEPRLMAHFSQDPVFMKIFQEGRSIYEAVIEVLDLVTLYKGDKDEAKRIAKIMWLALAYNAGAYKLSQSAGISRNQAEVFIQKMRHKLSTFFYWRDKTMKQAEIDGGIKTLFGRFIPLKPDLMHLAPNYMIQGSAAEINKLGLQAVRNYRPVINCHDEVLFEAQNENDIPELQKLMTTVVELTVPITVSCGTGSSWSAAKN